MTFLIEEEEAGCEMDERGEHVLDAPLAATFIATSAVARDLPIVSQRGIRGASGKNGFETPVLSKRALRGNNSCRMSVAS